jgi:L-fuculose-phosphate aldolase
MENGSVRSNPREEQLRRDLVEFGHRIHQQGFVSACDGNLSVRLDDRRVLATPSGVSKGMMCPEQMVVVDLEGNRLAGDHPVSSEIQMHLTIYRERPDVSAVVHAHPVTATGFASAGMALDEPICSEIIVTLGAVPLAEYGTTGTPALSESLMPWVHDYDAILLANHGAVSYGCDLLSAYMKMEALEHFAQIVLVTKQLGHREVLGEEEIQKLLEARAKYEGNKSQSRRPAGPLSKLIPGIAGMKSIVAALATSLPLLLDLSDGVLDGKF